MKGKKVALYGATVALAMVLSYIDSLIPVSVAVPGIKLGLANIAVVFALYKLGYGGGFAVSAVRVLLVSVTFGNAAGLIFSASGAVLSFVIMSLMMRTGKFGCTGVSVAGGVSHNAGQIAAAALVAKTPGLVFYLPALCVSGTVAGICIGLVAGALVKRVVIK